MTDPSSEGWHLDKKVPISIILALLMQGVVGLWAIADIKKDVEILKSQVAAQHERDERQDRLLADAMLLIRSDMKEIKDQLNRLIEKGRK